MIIIALTGFALIAGMMTKRTYGCDTQYEAARHAQSVARFKERARNDAALLAFEARVRRITLR